MINLHDFIDALCFGKVWEPTFKRTLNQAFPEQNSWLIGAAQNAVCFDMGDVNNAPKLNIISALFRMPYSVMWLEGKNSDGMVGILACEIDIGVVHAVAVNKRLGIAWQAVCIVEVFIENEDLRCRRLAMLSDDETINDRAFDYAAHAVNLMARFIMAMNCTNTTCIEHKAPKLINQKRALKGRQPLFSYWTLHLPGSVTNDGPKLGGTHASPRIHLRRGHIRQYAPDKYTWVEACVVGNKKAGLIIKDYDISEYKEVY